MDWLSAPMLKCAQCGSNRDEAATRQTCPDCESIFCKGGEANICFQIHQQFASQFNCPDPDLARYRENERLDKIDRKRRGSRRQ